MNNDDLQSRYKSFYEKWRNAPEMMEELEELRSVLQEVASTKISASIQAEINKIGWGIVDDNGVDYSELRKKATQKLQALVDDGRAVISTIAAKMQPESAACVLDAFNGYANHYLLKRTEPYAKRVQMVKLAFYLVNLRAKAMNLCITKEYLNAQLDLLRIQEEIAAYRARKRTLDAEARRIEGETEEINKKLYALRSKLERAHAKEKEKLLEQIAELEKRQRSISNAELTKEGVVYIISNVGSFGENVYKIGMTRRTDPQERIDELGVASVPFPFDVHAFIHTKDAPALETELHHVFKDQKLNSEAIYGREFYCVSLDEVKQSVSRMGYRDVEWHEETSFNPNKRISTAVLTPSQTASIASITTQDVPLPPPAASFVAPSPTYPFSTEAQFLCYLDDHQIKWVDKRNVGGCLWVESTPEIDKLLQDFTLNGIRFMLGKPKNHFGGNKGWFLAK